MTSVQNKDGVVYNEMFLAMTLNVCCNCGVPFGMPERLNRRFADKGGTFYCLNGHPQHYTESTETTLKKQLEKERQEAEQKAQQLQARIESRDREIAQLDSQVKSERGKANYHKGKRAKIEARVAHGVCACCNRTFPDLAAHMASKHPEELSKR